MAQGTRSSSQNSWGIMMIDRLATNKQIYEEIKNYLNDPQIKTSISLFLNSHPDDQVEIFEYLYLEDKSKIPQRVDVLATSQLFSLQEDQDTLEARLSDVLNEMALDEAADLHLDLPHAQAVEAIGQREDADEINPHLKYQDETAGGRMTTDFISIPQSSTTSQAIDQLRQLSLNYSKAN